MKDKKYHWFIEPLNASTNYSISQHPSAKEIHENLLGDDGEKHNVMEFDWNFVNFLNKSKETANVPLIFKVWNRLGDRGILRAWKFPLKKNKIRRTILKQVKQMQRP